MGQQQASSRKTGYNRKDVPIIPMVSAMRNLRQAGLALGLSVAGIGSSWALDCGLAAPPPAAAELHPECNAAASTLLITSPAIVRMQAIGNQSDTGFAQNDSAFYFGSIRNAVTIGGDYRLSPASTVGISASYDAGSVRLENGSGLKAANNGVNVAPYFAYQFSKNYSMDAALGVGWGSLKQSGGSPFFAPDSRGDAQRRFAGVGLNYVSKGGISGGVSYTSEFGNHDAINNVLKANLSVRF